MDFTFKVYQICKLIPYGNVVTYKQIALKLGSISYRVVGSALKKNINSDVPCHRVIKSNLDVGNYNLGRNIKLKRLSDEGVKIKDGKVDLGCIYKFE